MVDFQSKTSLPLLLWACCLTLAAVMTADAQQPAPFRSVTHPYEEVPPPSNGQYENPQRLVGSDLALAATNGSTAWYSAGVNRVLCGLLLPEHTWLGTAFGIKRLDARTHTTQHYTPLDGLPYPTITALASDGKTVWCASVRQEEPAKPGSAQAANGGFPDMKPRDKSVALCRFDAQTAKWKVVAEVSPEETMPLASPAPYDNGETEFMPPQWVGANATSAFLVPGPCVPGKTVALIVPLGEKAGNTDTERVSAPDFLKQPLVITTAQMDARHLWLGTRQGLLRFDLQTRRWETLLPDAAVFGGVRANDSSVWILARAADPFQKDMEQGMTRRVHWSAVHFAPGQPPRSYPVKERREGKNERGAGGLENITLTDNKVWITVNQRLTWGHGQMIYPPEVYSLDPQTGIVKVEASSTGSAVTSHLSLPPSVLANSHTGWGVLTPLAMPFQFPGWLCAADPKEAALLEQPRTWPSARDEQGRDWIVRGVGGTKRSGNFLVRRPVNTNDKDADEDYHELPSRQFTVHDEAMFPVTVEDKVYFLTGRSTVRLCAWDRKTNRVEPIAWADAALKQNRGDWLRGYKMLPGKDCLWISTENDILRCDLKAQRAEVWHGDKRPPQSYVPRYALAGVDGDTAWVKSAPNQLFMADAAHLPDLTPVALPPFPGDLGRIRDKMILFAVEDHIAWFTGQAFIAPNNRPLIGYNLQTRRWTKPFEASVPFVTAGETLPVRRQGQTHWFPAWSKEATAYGYDTARGEWTTLPPITPDKNYTLQFAAIDAKNAWLTDMQTLYHLDRAKQTWDQQTLPFHLSGYTDEGSARLNESLYLATASGVWACDTAAKRLTQSPGVTLPSEEMSYQAMSVDARAVWLTASRSDTYFVCRFDRASGAWKYWSKEDGLPTKHGLLTSDGLSCWLCAGGLLYHLNPQTDRWDNTSSQLAGLTKDGKGGGRGDGKVVPIQQVLIDGASVWLLPGVSLTPYIAPALPPDTPVAASSPLYRYRLDTRQIEATDPAPGKTLAPYWLTASARSLLLSAKQGVYRLDRASGKWQAVTLPALPAVFPASAPYAAREQTDQNGAVVWVIGLEEARPGSMDALRFRLPTH